MIDGIIGLFFTISLNFFQLLDLFDYLSGETVYFLIEWKFSDPIRLSFIPPYDLESIIGSTKHLEITISTMTTIKVMVFGIYSKKLNESILFVLE